ncbi:hypothetical protein GTS_34420 [Gandjariella thermophila]|uniref:Uncharacterized protein n=1 Tax=Gandjariella thermophila TaxID=1931992 RepID=A0A4D4JBQ6_9PSEU|nr:hypothetical protein [Gandjariella thermophila]GDY31809.1 hypothetical protein GTS_34420 [Gandjariella thermophila]
MPTEAAPDHTDALRHGFPVAELIDGGPHVRQGVGAAERAAQFESPAPALVGAGEFDARSGTVVEVRRDRDVSEPRDPLGQIADVTGQPEHPESDEHRGTPPRCGRTGEVGAHRRVGRAGHRDVEARGDDLLVHVVSCQPLWAPR